MMGTDTKYKLHSKDQNGCQFNQNFDEHHNSPIRNSTSLEFADNSDSSDQEGVQSGLLFGDRKSIILT